MQNMPQSKLVADFFLAAKLASENLNQ